jgi:hypothetical protein
MNLEVLRSWTTAADEALDRLPAHPVWPAGLYRNLARIPRDSRDSYRIVIGFEKGHPVGLIAFHREDRVFVPVTHWVLPGIVGFGAPGVQEQMLRRLPFRSIVAWWRMDPEFILAGRSIRRVSNQPTFGVSLSSDFEAFWKKTGCLRTIRRAERNSEGFAFQVNAPGALEWIVKNSERKWREDAEVESPRITNCLMATACAERIGKHFSLTLSDHETFIAGQSVFVHGHDIICGPTYRDPRYDHAAPGHAILAKTFYWGRDRGYAALDLGGGFDYKQRWVPIRGSKSTIHISPTFSHVAASCLDLVASMKEHASHVARRFSYIARQPPPFASF